MILLGPKKPIVKMASIQEKRALVQLETFAKTELESTVLDLELIWTIQGKKFVSLHRNILR
jgi:hypothetical protein